MIRRGGREMRFPSDTVLGYIEQNPGCSIGDVINMLSRYYGYQPAQVLETIRVCVTEVSTVEIRNGGKLYLAPNAPDYVLRLKKRGLHV